MVRCVKEFWIISNFDSAIHTKSRLISGENTDVIEMKIEKIGCTVPCEISMLDC